MLEKQTIVGEKSEFDLKADEEIQFFEQRIARREREFAASKDAAIKAAQAADARRIAQLEADKLANAQTLEEKRLRLITEAKRNKTYGKHIVDFIENKGFRCGECGAVIAGLGFDQHFVEFHVSLEERIKLAARLQAAIDKEAGERLKAQKREEEEREKARIAKVKKLKERGYVIAGPIVY